MPVGKGFSRALPSTHFLSLLTLYKCTLNALRMQSNSLDKAVAQAENGRNVARIIDDAIATVQPTDALELSIHAHRIRLCNNIGNIWHATDLHNADGELYDGAGTMWACGSKLCPACLSKQSRRNRSHLRNAIQLTKLMSGQHRHFLTLTFPKTELPLLQARAIMNYAWSLFRKRSWFRRTIFGGARSEEFTVSKRRYHYHMHILCVSGYIDFNTFRHTWNECVATAFKDAKIKLEVNTSDRIIVANCERVRSIDDAINELAKYITKTNSWAKMPPDHLLDIARIRRFPRMFEIFGTFRLALRHAREDESEIEEIGLSLDTESVNDEVSETGWRSELERLGAADYLDQLRERIAEHAVFRMEQLKRRYAYALFYRKKPDPTLSDALIIETALDRVRSGRVSASLVSRSTTNGIGRGDCKGYPHRNKIAS